MEYSYKDYWRELHGRKDLSSVGQSALPAGVNTWIYRSIRRNLARFARSHGLAASGSGRLLEVGVGTGYWVGFWRGLGWEVDGCDLVPEAVESVRLAHPEGAFWVADVSSPQGLLPQDKRPGGGYDLVTVTSVLLHVTADDAFNQALANVAAAVRPGGHLLLVEPALTIEKKQAPFQSSRSSRARVLRSYQRPLRRLGLELVAVEATTVLAANPLEASSARKRRFYEQWWSIVARSRTRPWLGRVLGPVMYLLDGLLMHTGEAPTSKVMLFRRADPAGA